MPTPTAVAPDGPAITLKTVPEVPTRSSLITVVIPLTYASVAPIPPFTWRV